MKKYAPFILTGLFSAALAFGLFILFDKPTVIVTSNPGRPMLTNYAPFESVVPSAVMSAPDLVKASNTSKRAVAYIESRQTSGGYLGQRNYGGSTGSGVVISPDGYIATNHHVVADGNSFAVLLDDGREFDAKLIGSDPSTDLALLKVEGKNLPYMAFGNSDSLLVGEWVLAIGNPFRLYSTVTAGIVSAKSRNINILDDGGIESFIQTDAAVNPGNSGGALVNAKGQLMGINTAIMTFSGQYEGFSFAIPSNLAKKVLEDIRQYGSPRRGWLGVVIRPVDSQTADREGLAEVAGVVLEKVNEQSAADVAGLQEGDIVLMIDGKKVTSSPDFMGQVGQHHPGDVLILSYVRDGKKKEARVKLSDSRNGTLADGTSSKVPEVILQDLGMTVRDLNEYEEARLPKGGVIVSEITSGSQIANVNMEKKFIITRLNGVPTINVEALKQELRKTGSSLYFQGYYENFPGDFAYSLSLK